MPNSIVNSFSKRSGKSVEEVEKIWNKIKDSLISQGRKETDDNFFAILTGSLKKALKLESLLTLDSDELYSLYLEGEMEINKTPHRIRQEPMHSASKIFKRDQFRKRREDRDKELKKRKKKKYSKESLLRKGAFVLEEQETVLSPFPFKDLVEKKIGGIIITPLTVKDRGVWEERTEIWEIPDDPESRVEVKSAYDKEGYYLGETDFVKKLVKKFKIDKLVGSKSIGLSTETQTWFGWSHRAIVGFTIGDKIFEPNFGDDNTLFKNHGKKKIKTLDDAKKAAIAFARYVS